MSEEQTPDAISETQPTTTNGPAKQPSDAVLTESGPNIDAIMDISVKLSIVVGSTHMKLKDLLKLSKGAIIELNKASGEPLDILVNGALIAHGEVVVVNEKYGIRLTQISSKTERLKNITN